MNHTASGLDPKSSDLLLRYSYPYPIAASYRAMFSSHYELDRVLASFRFVECMIRFLTYGTLLDRLRFPVSAKERDRWFGMLVKPGLGKLLGLLRLLVKSFEFKNELFLFPVTEIMQEDHTWYHVTEALIKIRNECTHNLEMNTRTISNIGRDIGPKLRDFILHTQFLANYRMGLFEGLSHYGNCYEYFWYASVGLEETAEPVRLKGKAAPVNGIPALMRLNDGKVLYLSPFFYCGELPGSNKTALMWVTELMGEGKRNTTWRYRHPVLNIEQDNLIVDPRNVDAGFQTSASFLKDCNKWVVFQELKLSEESLKSICEPFAPNNLDERFQVIGKIGQGAMGTVWDVWDRLLDRRCALKQLHREYVNSRESLQRFLREGKLMAKLEHPGIVNVYDIGVDSGGCPFILMEMVHGENLLDYLERTGPVNENDLCTIIQEIADAVDFMHKEDIIHRDIKPSNIIKSRMGIKVVDFGIAVVIQGTHLTRTIEKMGTPGYMAPEQWSDNVQKQSDVYSLGKLIYFLLSGRHPNPAAKKPEPLPKSVSFNVKRAYQIAIADDYRQRFETAGEFARSLSDEIVSFELKQDYFSKANTGKYVMAQYSHEKRLTAIETAIAELPYPLATCLSSAGFSMENSRKLFNILTATVTEMVTYLVYALICQNYNSFSRDYKLALGRLLRGNNLAQLVKFCHTIAESIDSINDDWIQLFKKRKNDGQYEVLYHAISYSANHHLNPNRTNEEFNTDNRTLIKSILHVFENSKCLRKDRLIYVKPKGDAFVTLMGSMPVFWRTERCEKCVSGLYLFTKNGFISLEPFYYLNSHDRMFVYKSFLSEYKLFYRELISGDTVHSSALGAIAAIEKYVVDY